MEILTSWQKSSRSANGGNSCVEVAIAVLEVAEEWNF